MNKEIYDLIEIEFNKEMLELDNQINNEEWGIERDKLITKFYHMQTVLTNIKLLKSVE